MTDEGDREPQPIIILGTGGNSVDILDTLNDINRTAGHVVYRCLGFLDDDNRRWNDTVADLPVLGPLKIARLFPGAVFVNGIGSDSSFVKKEEIISETGVPPERFATLIHPTASVSTMSRLGHGVVVLQNVTIASNVTIGNHVIILPNSVISHDDIIGDYTTIAGGVCISGNVTLGRLCYVGTNASIIGNVSMGDRALIGMGSVVLRDVDAGTVVVGSPARVLRRTMEMLDRPQYEMFVNPD